MGSGRRSSRVFERSPDLICAKPRGLEEIVNWGKRAWLKDCFSQVRGGLRGIERSLHKERRYQTLRVYSGVYRLFCHSACERLHVRGATDDLPTRVRHPYAITLNATIQVPAVLLLQVEGTQSPEERAGAGPSG